MTVRLPDFVPDFQSEASFQRWRDEFARLNPEEPMPVCEIHKGMKPMQQSANGGAYYCPNKMPDGSWCKTKTKAEAPPPATNTSSPSDVNLADALLAAGALKFAAHVWGPVDPAMHDEVLAGAVKAFGAMKKAMS